MVAIPARHSLVFSAILVSGAPAGGATPDGIEWFESRIRPVLAQECYECHNSEGKQKGGLVLDHRQGMLDGGNSGAAIVPGDPAGSLLLRSIRHELKGTEMPRDGAKLDAETVAAFEKWIAMGAPDPRDEPPDRKELESAMSWDAVRDGRAGWWSFQPIRSADPPPGAGDPVDRFLEERLRDSGVAKVAPADRRTLLRRTYFTLVGLPPTPDELAAFLADEGDDAYARVVDRLLASPAFGERWARQWLDWVRYAESHGSEGDPAIPHAYRYRDYVIRAFNADVPYDQLVRESLAGDLLPTPRINVELGINESMLGPGQFRMTQHGFAPTDALDELVRFTDNQIDTVTKAFLGLTVSCARCHNHKFDPISQTDFYALFGIFASSRPALVAVDSPEKIDAHRGTLDSLKSEIREVVARGWLEQARSLGARLLDPDEPLQSRIEAANDAGDILRPWKESGEWAALAIAYAESAARLEAWESGASPARWRLGRKDDFNTWSALGTGMGTEPGPPGEFHVPAEGPASVGRIFPSGVISHRHSTKDAGVLTSPRAMLEGKSRLFVRVAGDGGSMARYVIRNYPRNGTVYPVNDLKGGEWQWMQWNLDYWSGDEFHFELTTAADSPVLAKGDVERSWFALREMVLVGEGEPEPREEIAEWLQPLFADANPPADRVALAGRYASALTACVEAWRTGTMSDGQALFLDRALAAGLVNAEVSAATPLVSRYRELERSLPVPTRAPGVAEGDPFDQALFERGDHKRPLERVPRRFLEAIDPTPYQTAQSGRAELAESILAPANPLAARVAVNRLWQGVFGRGLVPTVDNFGRLGEKPSHPELLDFLARRFVEDGWSMKRMIRSLVMTEAFRRDTPTDAADPENALLSGYATRRLDAEAIRDALLSVSGALDPAMFGPGIGGESPRRSIYVRAIRNAMDPFLEVFDAPVPFATRGRRDATNVPAQSLAMLNSPFVRDLASRWADTLPDKENPGTAVAAMLEAALGRPPTADEIAASLDYLNAGRASRQLLAGQVEEKERSLAAINARLNDLTGPVYLKLGRHRTAVAPAVDPVAWWDFEKDANDRAGTAHGQLRGSARLENGALVLDGGGYLATGLLDRDIREKTLEAWVMLDTLDQRGGAALSVQSADAGVFDAIVYAEQEARKWLPGSDLFNRTRQPSGDVESEALERPVHLAITYAKDGTVTTYRDGESYGKGYASDGPYPFRKGQSQILVGCRHGEGGEGRLLRGRVLEARLYDRALSGAEVKASSSTLDNRPSPEEVLAALEPAGRETYTRLIAERETIETSLSELRLEAGASASDPWADLAHAVFNLKEFIYLR